MNIKKIVLLSASFFFCISMVGCGSNAGVVTLSNGKSYYFSERCPRYRLLSNNIDVACYTKDDKYIGLMKPLTDAELYAWRQAQIQQRIEYERAQAEFNQTMQRINEQNNAIFQNNMNMINANNAALSQQISNSSIYQPNRTNVYNVRQVGSNNYMVNSNMYRVNQEGSNRTRVTGQDGSSTVYQNTGPITTGSDGTKCIKTGNLYRCSK